MSVSSTTPGVPGATGATGAGGATGAAGTNGASGTLSNLLVNPGQSIWQRGTGAFTANAAYTSDRWQINLNGTDTASIAQEATITDNNKYALKFTLTAGNGTTTSIRQQLKFATGEETQYGLRGQTVIAQMRVRANSAITCRAYVKSDGTGGTTNYSSAHTGGSTFETLSPAAYAIPTDATYVEVGVEMKTNNMIVYLAGTTLVVGSTAQAFSPLPIAEEWDRCLRYYELYNPDNGTSAFENAGLGGIATDIWQTVSFTVRKAVSPTVTKAGTWSVTNCGQPIVIDASMSIFSLQATSVAAGQFAYYQNGTDDTIISVANP